MYKYGVSFNCQSNDRSFEIGGGGEGDTSIDYVGNDLDKIEAAMLTEAHRDEDVNWKAFHDHDYVGKGVDVGGKVVAVIAHYWDEDNLEDGTYDLCVVFEYNNTGPIVID